MAAPHLRGDRRAGVVRWDMRKHGLDVAALWHEFPELRLLLLHGSRARGDAHEQSDWDFAYLAGRQLDELGLRSALSRALGTDRIDLVDLARAGGLVRYRAARDGKLVIERQPGDLAPPSRPADACDAVPFSNLIGC